MAITDIIAAGFKPFNAADELAQATKIRGAQTQNALARLQLERERDPMSAVNRARDLETQTREVNLNAAREKLQAARLQTARPQLSSLLGALGDVRKTMENKGVAAARQRLNERIGRLQSSGILPEDFELDTDIDSMSDEDFMREIEQAEQDVSGTLAALPIDERAPPAAIREMTALGYPMTREGFQQYNEDRGDGSAAGLEALIQEARLRGLLMEQEQAQRETEEAAAESEREVISRNNTINRGLEQTKKITELTRSLKGSMLQPGVPLSDLRRGLVSGGAALREFFTGDAGEAGKTVANFDTLRKSLRGQLIDAVNSGQFDNVTNRKLQLYSESLASEDISPRAIESIQADIAETFLEQADLYDDVTVENRSEYERLIEEIRGGGIQDFSSMNEEQIRNLNIDEIPEDQLPALERRMDELGL